jgi:ATP-binding cassette subfamily F protein 3
VREERKAAGIKPLPPPRPSANGHGKAPAPAPAAVPKAPSKNARRRQQDLEKAVERAEAELAALEDELAEPAAWATKYESAKSTARHTAAKLAVEAAYAALAEHEERALAE